MNKKNLTYKKSGVNIAAADNFIKFISSLNTKDKGKKKFSNIGGFSSITNIPRNFKKPKIVACTDGVGTKLEIANLVLSINLKRILELMLISIPGFSWSIIG